MLKSIGAEVSLFIDPNRESIEKSKYLGATSVELHTGQYAIDYELGNHEDEYNKLVNAANLANSLALKVNAGHGLNYDNLVQILKLPHLNELNIGHAIIAESVFIGLDDAIRKRFEGDLGAINLNQFKQKLIDEIKNRRLAHRKETATETE